MSEIKSLNDVIERLQYKANNIKAKLESDYFAECVSYLKSMQQKENAEWIPCSKQLPDPWVPVEVTVLSWIDNHPCTDSDLAYLGDDKKWHWHNKDKITVEVVAWKYYQRPEPYVPEV